MKLLKIRRFRRGTNDVAPFEETALLSAYVVRSSATFPTVIFIDGPEPFESVHLELDLAEFEALYATSGDIVDLTPY